MWKQRHIYCVWYGFGKRGNFLGKLFPLSLSMENDINCDIIKKLILVKFI